MSALRVARRIVPRGIPISVGMCGMNNYVLRARARVYKPERQTAQQTRRTACEHIEPPPAAKMSQKQNHLAGEGNTNLVLPANA